METVSVKFEDNLAQEVDRVMKKHHYTTKAEFIREAIRDKIKDLEKEESLKKLESIFGDGSHKKTSDEDLRRVREEVIKELLSK